MDPLGVLESGAGLLLLFFLPGFALARAVFPERRFRGPAGLRGGLELFVLSFVLSVVLTVVLGYLLLSVAPGGFSAGWTSPALEGLLAGFALAAFVFGLVEGAYARAPPVRSPTSEALGEEGAWELSAELDRLRRERNRVAARLREEQGRTADTEVLRAELARLREAEDSLAGRREAQYES